MKTLFKNLGQEIFKLLQDDEDLSLQISGEDTLYIRYNKAQVRQSTQVHQYTLKMIYKKGKKVLSQEWSLESDPAIALAAAQNYFFFLRKTAAHLAESPFEPDMINHGQSEVDHDGNLPKADFIFEELHQACQNTDFCGLVASGTQTFAIQNSKGQFHWFSKASFFVDYSLYFGERAVKSYYAGSDWSAKALKENIEKASQHLETMKLPAVNLKPGAYRVFLEPAAVAELIGLVGWESFGYRDFKSGNGLFIDLAEGRKKLSPLLTIQENFDLGFVPAFNSLGELSAPRLPLIQNGEFKTWLISTSSAQEFKVASTQASPGEFPRSLEILPGKLRRKDIISELGTGLYLANLHYVNASDQKTARLTGMTRFAAFWVEKGEIVGPIDNLRFDESLYEAWGPKLLALTDEAEVIPDISTYGARSLGGNKLPGMLIDQFAFTL